MQPSSAPVRPAWLRLKLSVLFAATFASLGVHLPFFPVWLASRNLMPEAIGVIVAAPTLIRAISGPWLTGLADRRVNAMSLLAGVTLLAGCGWFVLPFTDGFWTILPVVAFCAVMTSAIVPLTDVLTIDALRQTSLSYGSIRLWGSVAFLISSVGGGVVLGYLDPGAVPAILGTLSLLAAGLVWIIRDVGAATEQRRKEVAAGVPEMMPLRLVLVILGVSAIHASHAMVYAFGPILWVGQGYSTTTIGMLVAIGVAAEILLFARFSGSGPTFPASTFLLLGVAASLVRWAVMAFEPDLAITFALQCLHAFSFGATHLGSIAIVTRLAPSGQRGRAQAFISSASALFSAGAAAISGVLVQHYGVHAYLAMIPIVLGGLACIAFAARQPQSFGDAGKTSPSS